MDIDRSQAGIGVAAILGEAWEYFGGGNTNQVWKNSPGQRQYKTHESWRVINNNSQRFGATKDQRGNWTPKEHTNKGCSSEIRPGKTVVVGWKSWGFKESQIECSTQNHNI